MRKNILLVLFCLLLGAAQAQQAPNMPCRNVIYPVNRPGNKPPVPPTSWRPPKSAVVWVDLTIDTHGRVKDAVVTSSAGKEADDAVLKAVRQWTFDPARCDFTAVEMTIHAKVNLELGKAK